MWIFEEWYQSYLLKVWKSCNGTKQTFFGLCLKKGESIFDRILLKEMEQNFTTTFEHFK